MRKILLFSIFGLFSLQAISQSIPEYCLENDVAHKYLTDVQYDPNDYSYSRITDFCYSYPWDWEGEGKGVRLDFPKPVPIKLESALAAAGKLYVGESEDYSDADLLVMDIAQGTDSINVWNLIPGRTYNWKLVDAESSALITSGKFKTTGTLRMLKINNVFNVRDLGGWISELNGKPMKYGKIIRGSRLNVNGSSTKIITEDGIKELRRVGMRSELDMRDPGDSQNAKYAFFSVNNDCPLYSVNGAYNSRIATFANSNQSIIGVNKLIEWLKQDKPVYLHCSVGADRTGTVAYLVEALCGMSEDALCKEFELTSFSGDKINNSAVRNPKNDQERYERLVRQRDYTGRLDQNDNNESYKFAKMVAKIKTFPGSTMSRKVYNHLRTGVNGTSVSEDNLVWLVNYMVGYVIVKDIAVDCNTSVNMKKGQEISLNAKVLPDTATNNTLSYRSADPTIATVSDEGVIKAVGCGQTTIYVQADDCVKSINVSVEKIESKIPASFTIGGETYSPKSAATNKVKDGSFEYGYFYELKTAKDTAMTSKYFTLTKYGENVDSVYLESKIDGDEKSEGSIRMEWTTPKNRSFVFGFRVKNSTNVTTTNNENLKIMVTYDDYADDDPRAYVFEYPSYDGNWKEIQYGFTTSSTQNRLRILFTHLSKDGNNTCFDNFYLIEVDAPNGITAVNPVLDTPKADDRIFNLSGQEVTNPGKGVYIRNGKKYIIK